MTYRLTLTAPAATIDATDTTARTLAGVAVPYGQVGATSAGRLTIDAGAIRVPEVLRRVKLFREHGRTTPVGYALTSTDGPDRLEMTFTVGRTPDGDTALLEASEGIRDALSVELDNVQIEAGHVTGADLVAVAQVAVPAFSSAVLTGSDDGPQLDLDPDPEDPDDDPDHDTPPSDPASPIDPTTEETTMPETTTEAEAAAIPSAAALVGSQLPPDRAGTRLDASSDFGVFAQEAAARLRGVSSLPQVAAALNDIVPANTGDPGGAFLRPQWLGELWTPVNDARPMAALVGVGNLTAATFNGWRWTLKPKVASYAGNKTPVPSSPATAALVESGDPTRIAGAWDIDRIYYDFNTDMLSSFYNGAVESYAAEAEAALAQVVLTVAGTPGTAADLAGAISAIVADLTAAGASLDYLAMAPDVFAGFIGLTVAEVPWWLQAQATVGLGGTTTVAGVTINTIPSLPAGAVIGGDRRALDYRESGPIRVDAVNIPNGGIDLALFGYANFIEHSPDGIAVYTVTPPLPLASSRTAKKA